MPKILIILIFLFVVTSPVTSCGIKGEPSIPKDSNKSEY